MSHWIPHSKAWHAHRAKADFSSSELSVVCNLTGKPSELYHHKHNGTRSTYQNAAMQTGLDSEPPGRQMWRENNPASPLIFRPPIHWEHQGVLFNLSVDGELPMEDAVWEQKTFYTGYPGGKRYAEERMDIIADTGMPLLKHRPQLEAYCRGYNHPRAVICYYEPESSRMLEVVYEPNNEFWNGFVMPAVLVWKMALDLELSQLPRNALPTRAQSVLRATEYYK